MLSRGIGDAVDAHFLHSLRPLRTLLAAQVQPVSALVGALRVRYPGMFGMRNNLQVLDPVVSLDPVDVVNVIVRAEGAAKVALHNQPVPLDPDLLAIHPYPAFDVSLCVDPPRLGLCVLAAVVCPHAGSGAILAGRTARPERCSAVGAALIFYLSIAPAPAIDKARRRFGRLRHRTPPQ